jgi:hypothetical protein
MHDHPDRIPVDPCLNGRLYRIDARRLNLGVYRSDIKGFVGIRSKFGHRYLFTEFHWDAGPPYGTANPLESICECPIQSLVEYSRSATGELIENKELFDWIDARGKLLGITPEVD